MLKVLTALFGTKHEREMRKLQPIVDQVNRMEPDIRQLKDGMQVDFQVRRTEKGLEAFDVTILPTS